MKFIRSLLRNSLLGAGVLFAASVAFSGTSHAVVFDLTADFCTGGCGTPPRVGDRASGRPTNGAFPLLPGRGSATEVPAA